MPLVTDQVTIDLTKVERLVASSLYENPSKGIEGQIASSMSDAMLQKNPGGEPPTLWPEVNCLDANIIVSGWRTAKPETMNALASLIHEKHITVQFEG